MSQQPLRDHLRESLIRSRDTVWWLIRIMVPASAAVFVLQRTGVLAAIGAALEPMMRLVGLPGSTAMALITSVTVNLYAVIAMVPALGLDYRELAGLSLLCLVAHNFLVELAVTRRTGTPVLRMFAVRTLGGLLLAAVVTRLIPAGGWGDRPVSIGGVTAAAEGPEALGPALLAWAGSTATLLAQVAIIVTLMVVVTRWLQWVGITDRLARAVRHPLAAFGLPEASAPAWIVANTLGLAYGAAVLKEEADTGRLSPADGDLLNHHLGVSHSMLEDTALFAALGIPVFWIVVPRLVLALLVVWERRLERLLGLSAVRTRPAAADPGPDR